MLSQRKAEGRIKLSKELDITDRFDQMNIVVEELLKGNNPTTISKNLSMKRSLVLELLDEWRSVVSIDNTIRERAKEALAGADQHFSMIINRAWETVNQADANNQLGTKATALKLIADTESKRIDMLQKAGLLENTELSAQLLDTERKQEALVGILKDVTSHCDKCRVEVSKRLSEITNKVEGAPLD